VTSKALVGYDVEQDLLVELDRRYFDGRLTAAGYRFDVRNLDKPGELEFYVAPDGAFKIEDDGILGTCISETWRIFIDHHDDRVQEFRPTLLHEMAHAAVDLDRPLRPGADQHGRRFLLEPQRLCRRRRNLPQTASALLLHVATRQIFGTETALGAFRRYQPYRACS
jgi:hypothetical protein